MSCPLVLLPLCPRDVPTEGYLVAKSLWTVGPKASIVGPSEPTLSRNSWESPSPMHLGLLSGSGPVSAPFHQNPWSGWFSESTQSSSVRHKVGPASIWGPSSGVFVGPCRRCCPCIPKTFRDLVARHPDRAPEDGVFGVAFMFSVSLGCLK